MEILANLCGWYMLGILVMSLLMAANKVGKFPKQKPAKKENLTGFFVYVVVNAPVAYFVIYHILIK